MHVPATQSMSTLSCKLQVWDPVYTLSLYNLIYSPNSIYMLRFPLHHLWLWPLLLDSRLIHVTDYSTSLPKCPGGISLCPQPDLWSLPFPLLLTKARIVKSETTAHFPRFSISMNNSIPTFPIFEDRDLGVIPGTSLSPAIHTQLITKSIQ